MSRRKARPRQGLDFPPIQSGRTTKSIWFWPNGSSFSQVIDTKDSKLFCIGTIVVEVAASLSTGRQLLCTVEPGTDSLWFAWADEGLNWTRG